MCSLQIGEHPRFIGAERPQKKPEKKAPGRIEKSELLSELALQLTDDGVVKKPMTLELDHLLAGVHRPFWGSRKCFCPLVVVVIVEIW